MVTIPSGTTTTAAVDPYGGYDPSGYEAPAPYIPPTGGQRPKDPGAQVVTPPLPQPVVIPPKYTPGPGQVFTPPPGGKGVVLPVVPQQPVIQQPPAAITPTMPVMPPRAGATSQFIASGAPGVVESAPYVPSNVAQRLTPIQTESVNPLGINQKYGQWYNYWLRQLGLPQPGETRARAPDLEPSGVGSATREQTDFEQFMGSTLFDPEGYKALGRAVSGAVGTVGGLLGPVTAPTEGVDPRAEALAGGQINRVRYRLADGTDSRYVLEDGTKRKHAANMAFLMSQGQLPSIIQRSVQTLNGWSDQDMIDRGFFFNEKIDAWVYGEEIGEEAPQVAGAASPYPSMPGYGYSYNYPSGGGYPYYGGGGGGYPYPVGGGGVEINFPEGTKSFVDQQQAGRVPQRTREQAARFGAVSWRI